MRKLSYSMISALVISLLFSLLSYSLPIQQINTCPAKPYHISNPVTRGLQGILGLNWISAKLAESQVKTQLKKQLGQGTVNVYIKPYSAMDLVAGKFKSIDLKAKNAAMSGIFISSLEIKSLCDFIYLDYKKDPIVPMTPLYFGFKGTITQEDLDKSLSSKEYQNNLSKIKVRFGNTDLSLVDFLNTKINIEGNKIFVSADVHFIGTPKFMAIPVKMGAGLKVSDNKIKLTNIQMFSDNSGPNMGPVSDFIENMALGIFDFDSLNQNGTAITLKNINIHNGKIDVEGTVWIASHEG